MAMAAAPTLAEIKTYVEANLNEPAKIAAAMRQYNVSLDQIQAATGYTRAEMTDYIIKSNDPVLLGDLSKWSPAVTPALSQNYNKLPDYMKVIESYSGQRTIVVRNASEIDKLDIWTGMNAADIARTKAAIASALNGESGVQVLGVNGLQVKIPGQQDPQRQYPVFTARDVALVRADIDALKSTRPASNTAYQALIDCRTAAKSSCAAEALTYNNNRQAIMDIDARVAVAELNLVTKTGTSNLDQRYNAAHAAQTAAQIAFNTCMSATASTGKDCRTQGELALAKDNDFRRVLSDVKNQQCGSSPQQGLSSCVTYRDVLEPLFATQSHGIKKLFEGVEAGTAESRVEAYNQVIVPTTRNGTPTFSTATPPKVSSPLTSDKVALNKYIRANLEKPESIARYMQEKGFDLNAVQQATGYSREEIAEYIHRNNNPVLNKYLAQWQPPSVKDIEIDNYIKANLGDPNKIAWAMTAYKVDLDRIQKATGYTREQMVKYIKESNSTKLKQNLASWAVPTVTDAEINEFIRANLSDPDKIAWAMEAYNVSLDRVQRATGYTRKEITDYINTNTNAKLKEYLASWNGKSAQPANPDGVNQATPAWNSGDCQNQWLSLSKENRDAWLKQQSQGKVSGAISVGTGSYAGGKGNDDLTDALSKIK